MGNLLMMSLINKDHNLLTIFGTENGRPYLVDFELRVSPVENNSGYKGLT